VRRLAESEELSEKAAAKVLNDSDKSRAAYLKDFYGVAHELPTHYDLVLNTERLGPEQAVGAILNAAA